MKLTDKEFPLDAVRHFLYSFCFSFALIWFVEPIECGQSEQIL